MESIEIASDLVNSIALRSKKSQDAYKGNQWIRTVCTRCGPCSRGRGATRRGIKGDKYFPFVLHQLFGALFTRDKVDSETMKTMYVCKKIKTGYRATPH
jgi:hypothetical protein